MVAMTQPAFSIAACAALETPFRALKASFGLIH
jgi:hypothetical protein